MKILITAGPTWIKIDEVRILTSIFTGATGLYLAEEFRKKGDLVTILLNQHCLNKNIKGMRIISFRYFEEFREKITTELKKNCYDAIIHSAAVSDYRLERVFPARGAALANGQGSAFGGKGKIPSGKKELILKLTPAEKIIKLIRKLAKNTLLIQFKLEIKRKGLIEEAHASLKENKSDFVVANALEDLKLGYRAFLIDRYKKVITLRSKRDLFSALWKTIIHS
ncbi:MAG: phosphopantothenoylcysteine decarboxylase [Candidatus Omnitrophota bacterium]|nr:phosphopantothenoylcysteine decarboxylase [Candidatus Omnitrophota bacterium]